MSFERWHSLGNLYLLAERDELTPALVREAVGDADGIVQVLARGDDWAEIVIWNRDGSTAEMSGNATRIAAAWLGADATRIRVGAREVVARRLDESRIEQGLGPVEVGAAGEADGIRFVPVRVGNPHAVVSGDPAGLPLIGPRLERHPRFPQGTNVQVARVDGPGEVTARVWERGVGETSASGTGAVAVAAATHPAGEVVVHFPGGDLHVRLARGRAFLTGPAERAG